MTSERHERVKAIFAEVCELEPGARRERLAAVGADDEALREEILSLLAHDDRPAIDFDGRPAVQRIAIDPEAPLDLASVGEIAGYRLRSVLGEGGMGVVYLAEQDHPRRRVALKLIRPGLAGAAALRRFEHEAEVLGRLHHPSIAQIYAAGTAMFPDGSRRPWFAMELVEGATLTDHADRNDLDVEDRVRLLVDVCLAVQHAHQNGVIHRDLKPSNILVVGSSASGTADGTAPRRGRPKILDFGVARSMDGEPATIATRTGEFVGTLAYMSPEQCAGRADEVDARADVHALGVIAYELLGRRLPIDVEGAGILEAARRIAQETAPSLGALDPRLRGDLETIVGKAMRKEPGGRYATASELALDLERFLHDEPVLARPASAVYQVRKFARRHRGLVVGAVGTAILLVVASAVSVSGWIQARSEADRTRLEAETVAAVNDFLNEMIGSVNPELTENPDLTMREVLDRAAEQLDASFVDRPLIRASLHLTIGRTYGGLGLFDAADRHLLEALAIRESRLDPMDPAIGDVLHALTVLHKQFHRLDQVLEFVVRLVAIDRAAGGPDAVATLDARVQEAIIRSTLAEYDAAQAIFDDALPRWRRVEPDGSARFATAVNEYGTHLVELGRLDEAEAAFRESIDAARRHDGEEALSVALAEVNLAGVCFYEGRSEEALEHLEIGVAIRSKRLAPDHPGLTSLMHLEGLICRGLGEIDRAARRLQEALALMRGRTPEGDATMAVTLKAFGDVRMDQGRYAEGIEAIVAARALLERDFGSDHPILVPADLSAAAGHLALGQFEEGHALLDRAEAIVRATRGDPSAELAGVLRMRGDLLLAAGATDEAMSCFERSQATRVAANASDTIQRIAMLRRFGMVHLQRGDPESARSLLDTALAFSRAEYAPDHVAIAEVLQEFALVHRAQGDREAAESALAEAIAIYTAVFPGDHPGTATCRLTLGAVRRDAGAAGEGESSLRDALAMRTRIFGPDAATVEEARGELARCLEAIEAGEDSGAAPDPDAPRP